MTQPKPGRFYRDADGRLLRLLQRVDPRGDTPPYWRVVTVNEIDGVNVGTGQPTVTHADGRESTIREDRLDEDYTEVSA